MPQLLRSTVSIYLSDEKIKQSFHKTSIMRGQRACMRGQRADMRGQRADMRGQRADMREQRADMRGQRAGISECSESRLSFSLRRICRAGDFMHQSSFSPFGSGGMLSFVFASPRFSSAMMPRSFSFTLSTSASSSRAVMRKVPVRVLAS